MSKYILGRKAHSGFRHINPVNRIDYVECNKAECECELEVASFHIGGVVLGLADSDTHVRKLFPKVSRKLVNSTQGGCEYSEIY